jgi:hypothetical protein
MWFFKRKNIALIPTAEEALAAIKKKNDKAYDNLRIEIGTWFRKGNHPYDNIILNVERPYVPDRCSNSNIDYLKPELEALGYEVLERIYEIKYGYTTGEFSTYNLHYRVIKIKDI